MGQVPGLELFCTKSDGTVFPVEAGVGVTLPAGTYFFNFVPTDVELLDVYLKWSAAVAGTFTLEATGLPRFIRDEPAAPDITDISTVAGDWMPQNPPSPSYVAVLGANNSVAASVVTAGGTNAGAAEFVVDGISAPRGRIHAVLTTGGVVRCAYSGKD